MIKYSVIIATSQNRINYLINRSLKSVYNQINICKNQWCVFIINDNEDDNLSCDIKQKVKDLRENMNLSQNDFSTIILKNQRTRFMSGTGSWNTGIYEVYHRFPDSFIAILDDDDEFLPTHLANCVNAITPKSVAVFERLIWHNEDNSVMKFDLKKEQLTTEHFFIGNPGVQGSNMFFKVDKLVEIGGFDENLPNTTDRDLMIRFLLANNLENISVIENVGVIHYNHKGVKVNNDYTKKQIGLNLFYKKYKNLFSKEAHCKSIERAKKLFKYNPQEQIIICMPVKNAENTIERAINSFLNQKNVKRELILLIGNDNSTDKTTEILNKISSKYDNIIVLNVSFGNVASNRNFLNQYARENYPNSVLIGRLDADDFIDSEYTLNKIEKLFDDTNFDALICGNKQIKNGTILPFENKPSKKLLEEVYLSNRLFQMKEGNPKAELPSCNTFIKPSVLVEYPDKKSAEDHWFVVFLFQQKEKLNICIDEELIYCVYSLDGLTTSTNKVENHYYKSRLELYEFYREQNK